MSKGEETLAMMLTAYSIEHAREWRFAPPRRWRADFALLDHKILIEVEGGLYINGRHQRATGYENDLEKYNKATLLGWRVLRYSTAMVISGEAIAQINEAIST